MSKKEFEYKGFAYDICDSNGMINDRGQRLWKITAYFKNGDTLTAYERGATRESVHVYANEIIEEEIIPYYLP